MKILVWGINYAPEATGIAPCSVALCERLLRAGHDVHMLTTFAYYPNWQKAAADTGQLYRTDELHGVPVHRCWHYVPRRASALKRILHEASFVLTSFVRALTLPGFDVAVVVSPPLLLGTAATLLAWIKRAPFVFHVQDLQPDAAVGLGMLKRNAFTWMLYRLEAFAYRYAARVSGISQGMLRAFESKGVPERKRFLFPNGVPKPGVWHTPEAGRWREKMGFTHGEFLAVYAGNLGIKQGLDILLEAAPLLRDARVRIIICGQGAAGDRLREGIEARQLPNLTLLPLQDDEAYPEMMLDSDVCLITQQAGTGQYFFPSKLLSALTFAKPVFAVADAASELSMALEEGGFGVQVPPDHPQELADALDRMAGMGHDELVRLGEAGWHYGERFAWDRVLVEFEAELAKVKAEGEG